MNSAKRRFPVVIKEGSVSVRIYRTPTRGCEAYTLSFYQDGIRHRPTFKSYSTAELEARLTAKRLGCSDADVLLLKSHDRAAYLRAQQLLKPVNTPIEIAAAAYAEAKQRLGDVPLAQVVDFYLKRHPQRIEARSVQEVVAELLEAKRADHLSDRYIGDLRYCLGKFAATFHGQVMSLSGRDIDAWLRELGVSPRTRNNLRNAIQTFFNFAKARRYLPKDHDELDAVAVAKARGGAIEIFTPAEMRTLLNAAPPELVPFLALGAFAGIRHAEIQRLDWADVRFEDGIIEIRAINAKTASRRTIPILPNLTQWIRRLRETAGPVCSHRNMVNEIVDLVKAINASRVERGQKPDFAWKHNALRHSFISYRVAVVQNVAQVALEAGNSPQMIFRHYRELVRPADAQAWFDLAPDQTQADDAGAA